MRGMEKQSVSVVVPAYNEAESLPIFYERVTEVLDALGRDYEIVIVDDGSRDNTYEVLEALAAKDSRVKAIGFRNNFGQTAALAAGIDAATGEIIVLIDSDLENDPADIPRLLAKIEEGHDVVSGWRQNRWKNEFITRKLPSMGANMLISKITGVHLNDFGCTLKAYRAEVVKSIPLYGEMHRFIPAYAKKTGGRITEIPVNHSPRQFGKSNYGFSRLFRVLPDLLLYKFLEKYMNRPMHFFAYAGFWSFFLSFAILVAAVFFRFAYGVSLIQTPLPTLSGVLLIIGVQFFLMGIVSEMLMRTYYESQKKKPYVIKRTSNLGDKI